MRKILLTASAALIAFSAPALAQGHGGGGGDHGGGPPAGVGGGAGGGLGGGLGGPGGLGGLPPGSPQTIPPSDNANARASGQVQGDVHAQTDIHASDRAHERTGASVDHSANAATGAGLATKTYRVGQHVSGNIRFYTNLSAIPDTAKSQIPSQYMTDAYRYIYQTNRIYVVDSATSKVTAVVNLNP
jgi:hypothetical protein